MENINEQLIIDNGQLSKIRNSFSKVSKYLEEAKKKLPTIQFVDKQLNDFYTEFLSILKQKNEDVIRGTKQISNDCNKVIEEFKHNDKNLMFKNINMTPGEIFC